MWQLPHWDMGCSVGVSYSDQTPVQGPVTAVLWQQAVGAFGGAEGGVAGRETKGPSLGGIRVKYFSVVWGSWLSAAATWRQGKF